jgi:thymidine phosphorylase
MFRVKKIMLSEINSNKIILNYKDSEILKIQEGDKIKVIHSKFENQNQICEVEIYNGNGILKIQKGEIGLFEKVYNKLELIKTSKINLAPFKTPKSMDYVKEKFVGKIRLNYNQFKEILQDIMANKYSKIEETFFILASHSNPYDINEIYYLTKAMIDIGNKIEFKTNKFVVDKHCIGGVPNNRTSILIVVIMSCFKNYIIPKTSSRSITSAAGTADTVELLTKVNLSGADMLKVIKQTNGCLVWGGGVDLSPADDELIKIEHPLKIDFVGQMIASILSKKICAGAKFCLIDIPYGKNAKVKDKKQGKVLKEKFEKVSLKLGLKLKVILTKAEDIIGNGVGPYLEILDIQKILNREKNRAYDLEEKSIMMCEKIIKLANPEELDIRKNIIHILDSGLAKNKFQEIINIQGKRNLPKPAKFSYKIKAKKSGKIKNINIKQVNDICLNLGCPNDKVSGLLQYKKLGEKVEKNEILFELFSSNELKLKYALNKLKEDIKNKEAFFSL